MTAPFFRDWPAEDHESAVHDCLQALRQYIPRRNRDTSYRASAKRAIEQARYLGLTTIGSLPRTEVRAQTLPVKRPAAPPDQKWRPEQFGLFDRGRP